ncbi:MAG: 50S ribosomal protein L2 [Patescibacteria group bacterium]|nr:50S ribosomal protein L2 [Patescibacteria group bacterium]
MALKRYKPTTPGQRGKISLRRKNQKLARVKSLVVGSRGSTARSRGRVSMRHRSAGAKKAYRKIDFKRDKYDILAKVEQIEYDPNRGSSIALILYADGERRYILRPKELKVGDTVVSSKQAVDQNPGNSCPLNLMPVGSHINCVELHVGKGGEMARGAGNFATITAKEGKYVNIKLPSGEVKKIFGNCSGSFGVLDNEDVKNISLGKAGIKKYLGRRSKVRGVAYGSPRSHPHGGSYKTSGVGRASPVSPWGQPAKGFKTRKRTHTDKFIVERK